MQQARHVASWRQLHSRIVLILVNCALAAVLLLGVEFGLRALGYSYTRKPGTLVLEDTFGVNKQGLFAANPASATFRHLGIGINREGFRSPEFDAAPSPRGGPVSVAIIGDSFAWGATATPISRSFADLLRAEGYEVHNLGIPGTGPLQYRRIAETYLTRLKPDVVIVALYLGNDVLTREWEPPPGRLLYYVIQGGGWIMPFDEEGGYLESVDAAYEHLHNRFGRLRRFLRETALGTLALRAARGVTTWTYERRAESRVPGSAGPARASAAELLERYAHTYAELHKIRGLAEQSGARYYTLVIPALGAGCLTSADLSLEAQRGALDDLQPVYADLSDRDYVPVSDCHLNNQGHAVVARALAQLLGPAPGVPADAPSSTRKKLP